MLIFKGVTCVTSFVLPGHIRGGPESSTPGLQNPLPRESKLPRQRRRRGRDTPCSSHGHLMLLWRGMESEWGLRTLQQKDF